MDNWQLAHVYEYWDYRTDAIGRLSIELRGLKGTRKEQARQVMSRTIEMQANALSREHLVGMAVTLIDDLYKAGDSATMFDQTNADYISSSCGVYLRLLTERGYCVHYVADLTYDMADVTTARPIVLFPLWFRCAGVHFVCPQTIAHELMNGDGLAPTDFLASLPLYIAEARNVADHMVDRCHAERRHYVLLDTDSTQGSFEKALSLRETAGVITVLRDTPATIGSKVSVLLPRE